MEVQVAPELIPITRPWLDKEEEAAVQRVLRSGWLMAGQEQDRFERDFAEFVNAPYARAVNSCTSGLQLALRAAGVQTGDVVATVTHSFIATANAARFVGAEPVFVDIDPHTLNIDPVKLNSLLEQEFEEREDGLWYRDISRLAHGESPLSRSTGPRGRLAAFLIVHQVGMPADMATIMALSKRYRLPVIEDAACAVGSTISLDEGRNWQLVGAPVGVAACFSFHPRKIITTGEGGIVTTTDETIAKNVEIWRQHGMDLSTANRHAANSYVDETYGNTAGNFRITDIQAAIGVEQVRRIRDIVMRRRAIAERYWDGLSNISGLQLPEEPMYARTNYQSYIVRLSDPELVVNFRKSLHMRGVDTRPGIMNAHLEAPYSDIWPRGSFPESEAAQAGSVILPLYPTMGNDMPDRVIDAVLETMHKLA